MDAARLKLGTNYLSQALHSTAVALPAPYGVGIAGRSPGVPPQEIVSKLEVSGGADVTLSAVAWCPAAPELLALAVDAEPCSSIESAPGAAPHTSLTRARGSSRPRAAPPRAAGPGRPASRAAR